ncbi:hypothetical protein COEREDRAFT_83601 [Coemansia reversa NRRL 1564]|uniref:UspA domain-containing protein n=1 Tax=Coemansia reversa (strain ATCC 12441 / NRRL 1564) TaxID=763665 RepID=A0A2G5B2N6_COERN|nr:hypothetical protein COEREDRAFT_83601 [Coemansia reversa NRRL 1564]|eukprot:PIA13251.1 hypothetical protein COEREDRAFT_83601 [Coemansia reversa NRRL 1564]
MGTYVPLSLRRKVVIAVDAEQLLPGNLLSDQQTTADETTETTRNRYSTFKTLAWVKANIIRPTEDHVFLVTALTTGGVIDKSTVAVMWDSLFSEQDAHVDRKKAAEAALDRLSQTLSAVGVSSSTEVLEGPPAEKIPEFVHLHRGELLVVQNPVRGIVARSLSYSWADSCVQTAECPTLVVKQSDLSDNVAVALDPPLPTSTADMTSAEVIDSE